MHNHLLPGIDDGSPEIETSMELLEGMYQLGFKNFFCTPHIFTEIYPNTKETIEASGNILAEKVKEKFPDVQLSYGAENMMDDVFTNNINQDNELVCIKDKTILIECSFVSPPINFKESIFNLQLKGYNPILAHPERYNFWHPQFSIFEELHNIGVALQVNILSIGGYYGPEIQKVSEKLIAQNLVSYLGTDLHHHRHLANLASLVINEKTANQLRDTTLLNKQL